MKKPMDFEALLKLEIRWPKPGEKPFNTAADWRNSAEIASTARSRMVLMASGYKKGADMLVEHTRVDDVARATLVYPILFNYRHYIELTLKYLIWCYGTPGEGSPLWKSHRLGPIWNRAVVIMKDYGAWEGSEADKTAARTVQEFGRVDPDSFDFRYSIDTDGKPMAPRLSDLDLVALREVMAGVEAWFEGADGYLDHVRGSMPY